jgi:hypothetical protein
LGHAWRTVSRIAALVRIILFGSLVNPFAILRINLKPGRSVRLPAEVLPPSLNRNDIVPEHLGHILALDVENPDTVIDELWTCHKKTAFDWMQQAELLPSW